MKRVSSIGAIALAAFLFAPLSAVTLAQAQGFPNKLVKVVVPYAAGGATDAAARTVTPFR
ncbi:MAG: hypothetical protein HY661_07165 [Betaproteobacteria bacterium]|nr:hypothetical protein [Betaproteobacteria bacterium]